MWTVYVEPGYLGLSGQFTDCEGQTWRRDAGTLGELLRRFAGIIGCRIADIRVVRC
jgi:hypothetical protein